MAVSFKQEIVSNIDSACNIKDLLPIIKTTPINKLKECVKEFINDIVDNDSQHQSIYFKTASFNKLMPSDIIQEILSYHHFDYDTPKLVNKKWWTLWNANVKKHYLYLQNYLSKKMNLDPSTKITVTILKKEKYKLREIERDLGYKSTVELNEVIHSKKIEDENICYLRELAWYVVRNELKLFKNLYIFGVIYGKWHINQKYFPTIFLRKKFMIKNGVKLWIENCSMSQSASIYVEKDACLFVQNCDFCAIGITAIRISAYAKQVIIKNCVIRDCNYGIEIINDEPNIEKVTLELYCTENKFKCIRYYPIYEQTKTCMDNKILHQIKNNVRIDQDDSNKFHKLIDPNKIY